MKPEDQSPVRASDELPRDLVAGQEDGGQEESDIGIPASTVDHHGEVKEALQAPATQVEREIIAECDETTGAAGDAEDTKIQAKTPVKWDTSASLYCARNGLPHSTLLDFHIDECPMCSQDISRPRPSQDTSRSSSPKPESEDPESEDTESDSTVEERTSENEGQDITIKTIQHAVEYKDAGGLTITVKEWDCPFNFSEARSRAMTRLQNRVLKVVTVLNTSVPRNTSWWDHEVDALEREMPIIENPKYSMAISSRKLVISSRPVISTLQELCSYDTGRLFEADVVELDEPYSVIAHHLDELEARRQHCSLNTTEDLTGSTSVSSLGEREVSEHLGIVLDYVNATFEDRISNELTRHASRTPTCTYRMLWLLFKPGTTVYMDTDGKWDAYIVGSVNMGVTVLSAATDSLQPCEIILWNLDFNGRHVFRRKSSTIIRPFRAEKPIMSLKVIPSKHWDAKDGGELRTKLENEGKRWYELLRGSQVNYRGEVASRGRRWLNGRAFADSAAYYDLLDEYETDDDSSTDEEDRTPEEWSAYDNIDPKHIKSLELPSDSPAAPNHRYLLCSRYLWGFVFATRTWEKLDVALCQSPKLNRTPFERLVMPEDQKLMIKALVYKYTDPRYAGSSSQQVWAADFIKNKGEGQIFLLHGGPGVGKTFTAECIAEFTGRPLLAITCGDLGTDEVSMETELGKWLKLAHKWGAVMMIDEADVFLEKRMEADLKRNSLVSVFLRELEYYQGILFLTTNRVGHFDDAFISRIHVVVHYQDLSYTYRRKIWNQFFDKLQEERGDVITIDNSARRYVLEEPEVCNYKWNGREIRNGKLNLISSIDFLSFTVFQTAVALAEYRFLTKPELEKTEGDLAVLNEADFKQVCEMAMKFKDYLNNVNEGANEHERAGQAHWRLAEEDGRKVD